MFEVYQAAADLQRICEQEHWKYCFIGGLALQRWGEARFTGDADMTIFTGFGREDPYVQRLLQFFQPRIKDAAAFALAHRVLLLQSKSGVGLDIALGALPFEQAMAERATAFVFPPDFSLRTCSAEDLIIMKAFADRGQDWVDIESVVIRQAGNLDWSYVWQELEPLVRIKESPTILTKLQEVRKRSEEPY